MTHSGPMTPRHFERSEAESRNLLSEKFPMVMTRSGASFRQEIIRKKFPMVMTRSEPTPDRKLYENKNPLLHGEDF